MAFQPQLVTHLTWRHFLDQQRCLAKLLTIAPDLCSTRRAGDLHASVSEGELHGRVVAALDAQRTMLFGPTIEFCRHLVSADRQLEVQWSAAQRLSIDG